MPSTIAFIESKIDLLARTIPKGKFVFECNKIYGVQRNHSLCVKTAWISSVGWQLSSSTAAIKIVSSSYRNLDTHLYNPPTSILAGIDRICTFRLHRSDQ